MKDTIPTYLGFTAAELASLPQARADAIRSAARIRQSGKCAQLYSECAYQAARALGKPAPISPEAQAAAIAELDVGPIVDLAVASRAKASRSALEDSGWGFSLEKRPTPAVIHDPNAGLAGRMASPRLAVVPPLALAGGRPMALATDPLIDRPTSRDDDRIRKWYAKHDRKSARFSAIATTSGELSLAILGLIGDSWFDDGITAKSVKAALDANPKCTSIRVAIDSPGGDAFMGIAIHSLLRASKKSVVVDVIGEASSAASIVAMAGDEIVMHPGSMMMIHRASGGAWGFSDDLRQTADVLDKLSSGVVTIYANRTGKPVADIEALVSAESWMTAPEALAAGFCTSITPPTGAAA